MTMGLNTVTKETVVDWFVDNAAWGHLDQIPDDVLQAVLEDNRLCELCMLATVAAFADRFVKDKESVPEAERKLVHAVFNFRSWCIAERLRRKNHLKIDEDILLLEMLTRMPDCLSDVNGGKLDGCFVDVSKGKVTFVGREIDL